MSHNTQEIEAALLICDDAPQTVADEVARLDSIAGYPLTDGGVLPIHDMLFDTAERTLRGRGYVLRVRRLPGGDLLTLKGESRAAHWGGVQRLEIEGAPGAETLASIEQALRRGGIDLALDVAVSADGVKTLRAAGLHPIQDRETLRRLRHLFDQDGAFAEMAIDRVSARIGARNAGFYQVEVESKGLERSDALGAVVSALESRFGGRLVRWHYGKLATLFALMRAAREEGLESLVDQAGWMTAHGCGRIKAVLERGK